MKKTSLGLLAVTFVAGSVWLGCGQGPLGAGSEPSGSERLIGLAKKGGEPGPPDKGGGSREALLDLKDGMLTTGLPVNVVTDSGKKLHLETHPFQATLNFANSGDWFELEENGKHTPITQEAGDSLQAELGPGKVVDNGSFFMEIDKAGLEPGGATSGGHFITFDYVGVLGETRIMIGGPYDTPVTVAWLSHTETVDVFQFTGTILVGKLGGGRKDSHVIGCPGVEPDPNKVVVTVTR